MLNHKLPKMSSLKRSSWYIDRNFEKRPYLYIYIHQYIMFQQAHLSYFYFSIIGFYNSNDIVRLRAQ